MSTMPTRTKMTEEEYLAVERAAETKSEFYDGEMYAMSGASFRHSQIRVNLLARLYHQFESRTAWVYNDLRVHVEATGSYLYPDVIALCETMQFLDDRFDTLLDPWMIIEVISPSTAALDQGRKFDHYAYISSLKEYVLVSQDRMQVDHYQRRDESTGWFFRRFRRPDEVLELESIGCAVPLSEIYARVDLSDGVDGDEPKPKQDQ